MPETGLGIFLNNLKTVSQSFWPTVVRHGAPTSDRTRSQTVFTNLFLKCFELSTFS